MAECSPSGIELQVTAKSISFDTDCLAAPGGEEFSIRFENQDALPHNLAIYESPAAQKSLFVGEIINGPKTVTYTVSGLEAGTYFFRCDVHPTQMTGTFVAEGG